MLGASMNPLEHWPQTLAENVIIGRAAETPLRSKFHILRAAIRAAQFCHFANLFPCVCGDYAFDEQLDTKLGLPLPLFLLFHAAGAQMQFTKLATRHIRD